MHENQTDTHSASSFLQRAFGQFLGYTFSNNFPFVDRRLISRKFCGNFGYLPGFGKVITFASFKTMAKVTAESNDKIGVPDEPVAFLEGA
jgi:hypothetical protein